MKVKAKDTVGVQELMQLPEKWDTTKTLTVNHSMVSVNVKEQIHHCKAMTNRIYYQSCCMMFDTDTKQSPAISLLLLLLVTPSSSEAIYNLSKSKTLFSWHFLHIMKLKQLFYLTYLILYFCLTDWWYYQTGVKWDTSGCDLWVKSLIQTK
jgi:hypothetical protein